uniref:Uncharacterized protein n=1 Tax=Arundo donax TaxID=35708 RepID=A0A0A9CAD3_ARUDO
MNCKVKAELYF